MASKIYDSEMQYLTIAYAKDIGLDKRRRVVGFDHRVFTHQEAGLVPLLVYSVVAPAFKFYARQIVDATVPISISAFLSSVWSEEYGLGAPLRLEVKKQLFDADKGYQEWLKQAGIQVSIASSTPSIRAIEAETLRGLRNAVLWGKEWWALPQHKLAVDMDAANLGITKLDEFTRTPASGLCGKELSFFLSWLSSDKRFLRKAPIWDDWDSSVIAQKTRSLPDRELTLRPGGLPNFQVNGLKDLVAMWPGGRRAFFKGLNAKAKNFNFWVDGVADISEEDYEEIRQRAILEYSHDLNEWVPGGCYLLEARTRIQAIEIYDLLSHGGDVYSSFEIVGPNCELTSHRFLYFFPLRGGPTIMLFERGKPVEAALNEEFLLGFQGIVRAPKDVWDNVSGIVEAREHFENPAIVAANFLSTHKEWLKDVLVHGTGFL